MDDAPKLQVRLVGRDGRVPKGTKRETMGRRCGSRGDFRYGRTPSRLRHLSSTG